MNRITPCYLTRTSSDALPQERGTFARRRAFARGPALAAVLVATLILVRCPSGQTTEGDDDKKTGVRFELGCSGGATLNKIDNETNSVLETGPVRLPAGKSCDDAQSLPEATIRKLPKHGDWQFFYKGTKNYVTRGRFENDGREGQWIFWDTEGRKTKSVLYAGGKKQGTETVFFAGTDDWRERGENVDDARSGPWEIRHAQKSDCVSKGSYAAGEKSGPWEECAQDAKTQKWHLAFRGNYTSGLRDGPAQAFDATGARIAEGSYVADTSEECAKKPPDGDKANCGKRTGFWKIYFPDGKLAMTGEYDAESGQRSGEWTEYYRSGEKLAQGPRKHTRRGHWSFFDKNGRTIFEADYEGNDFTPKRVVLYENGRKKSEGPVSVGLTKYDTAKDEFVIGTLVPSGVWIQYDAQGRKSGEGELISGKKNGKWQENVNGQWETVCYMLGKAKKCD